MGPDVRRERPSGRRVCPCSVCHRSVNSALLEQRPAQGGMGRPEGFARVRGVPLAARIRPFRVPLAACPPVRGQRVDGEFRMENDVTRLPRPVGWHGYVLIPVARGLRNGSEYGPMPPDSQSSRPSRCFYAAQRATASHARSIPVCVASPGRATVCSQGLAPSSLPTSQRRCAQTGLLPERQTPQ